MNKFFDKVYSTLKRSGNAFLNYPASMASAIILSVFAIIFIYIEPSNDKFYSSIMLTSFMVAILSLAFSVIAIKLKEDRKYFIYSNLSAIIPFIITFLVLYFPKNETFSEMTIFRVFAVAIISFLVFLFVPTFKSESLDYNKMIFMNIKAFFMSAVYGLVLGLGLSFVAFAIRILLYEDLSTKIFGYISIISGLVAYIFYLGYFPKFEYIQKKDDEKIYNASKQPKFATILFQNILIPIMGAMTLVLFIWILRIVITGDWPPYNQIIGIFTTYSLFGILIYFLVTSFDNIIVKIYKIVFPIANIIFLLFEGFPIIIQIRDFAVMPLDYTIILIWIFAIIASILFLFLPIKENRIVSYIACVLVLIYVLPVIGIIDFSYRSQKNFLEEILIENEMLEGNEIIPAFDISHADKIKITNSFEYLYYNSGKKIPTYLGNTNISYDDFRTTFGFERTYDYDTPGLPPDPDDEIIDYIYITLNPVVIALEDYEYFISAKGESFRINEKIITSANEYEIEYNSQSDDGFPGILVKHENDILIDETIAIFSNNIREKYEEYFVRGLNYFDAPVDEMSVVFENQEIKVKLVFSFINVSKNDSIESYFELIGIYFKGE